ncbi:MAG: methionine--tRNA ligase [Chloroflexi bacterium]|nr:methionine--tRNA ligase [Chloroflexota bacterium]MCI0812619.1 methionine--tRNA ligase [Chloroflexota bacterium]MCI0822338.1 methionine--tRNA ligase [Chloroflexota bacterium]MCI0869415.1 methionine--tRNA ligase [Chloroflexota bacterium]
MSERILVAVAWPYANGSAHIGHIAGTYLPADIFARYHRMKGNDVLMVSGSDAHGTPVTISAEERGVTPEDIYSQYQAEFLDDWKRLGISFDLFTTTHTDNHARVAQDMFLKLHERGYIYLDTMVQAFCVTDNRFLADRYVEGTCPHCNHDGARGDQCDNCGRTLDAKDLINIVCKICGNTPEFRETEHFFLKLSAFEDQLLEWVRKQKHWRPNVRNFTISFLEGGLHDRAITRDIAWGVPVPLDGYEGKRLYVWFEAVVGYLSASMEWAESSGNADRWKDFWQSDCRAYYFMGKDNIPFHTVIWPAMLLGYEGLNLPYDVPANEYLNMEGFKLSTSRNWAVWVPDYLDRYEPDPLRYVLSATLPETSDSDFSWREYVRRNNDELVATFGNLVHRVLSMVNRNFDGKVPERGELDDLSRQLLDQAQARLDTAALEIEAVRLRQGLGAGMSLAQSANRYLDQKAPWKAVKVDKADAARTLWVSLAVINCLKTALYPYLPFTAEKLHAMLGLEGSVQDAGWKWDREQLVPGQPVERPTPLFSKLDEDLIEAEAQRIGG